MAKLKLTDKAIRGLKSPAAGQTDYWDQIMPGFGIRVGHGGRKAFIVGTRINGKFTRITLRPPFPNLELAEARARARQIMADAQSGISPKAREKRNEKGTFSAVAEAFMTDYAAYHRSRDDMARRIKTDLAVWHDRPIALITRGDVKELIREKARTAPISANRLLSLVSKIFSWALAEELVTSHPALRIPRPGKESGRERNLTPDEIKCVWEGCTAIGYPYGDLLKVMLLTGQRRGEVSGMRWSEIDGDNWMLPGERCKRGKGHRVPLSTAAREIIAGVPEIGELVFTSRTEPFQAWGRSKKKIDTLCGFSNWHLRDLRRTFATQLRTLGVDRLVVSKLLNHAEGGITQIYDRYAADPEKSAAMERWANRLREIISGVKTDNVVQMRANVPK